jgi:transcription antitermination factor NusG
MVARPLFPGYLFVWATGKFWSVLDSIDGAFGCVRFGGNGGQTAIVSPRVIKQLRTWEGPTGYIRVQPMVKVGSRVTLRNGITGIYAGMNERHRIRILFNLLGQVVEREFFPKDLVVAA